MKKRNQDVVGALLGPCREEINRLDDQILKLLGARYDVVRKVARIKIDHDIRIYQGKRVEEVKKRNAVTGKKYGINPELTRSIYTLIIAEAHAMEESLREAAEAKAAKKKKARNG